MRRLRISKLVGYSNSNVYGAKVARMQTEAMVIRQTGGPEVLVRETIEIAEPGPREVLVRVRAVALNHVDLWVRRGLPKVKYAFPHRLGADIAGEIEALGPGAKGCTVGQKVLLAPAVSCGVCGRCLAGEDNLCSQYRIFGEPGAIDDRLRVAAILVDDDRMLRRTRTLGPKLAGPS